MARILDAYKKKRDFSKTPEPGPKRGKAKGNAFVVQKHDATRLHYDFRLELDGVMKSWAVTRGPSLVPTDKRLAVQTEDHPIDYNKFEGIIPKGQYGGGTVMIWDRGTWEPLYDAHKGLKKGHLEFELSGEKLRGRWHLVKMRKKKGEKAEPWLLIKGDDEEARTDKDGDILEEMDRSVVTGRTIPEIAANKDRVWNSNRDDKTKSKEEIKPKGAKPKKPAKPVSKIVGTAKRTKQKFVEPQLATLVAKAPANGTWVHEIKFDGYRLQAHLKNGKVTLYTRNGLDWSHRFPQICAGIKSLPVANAVLDGEAVVEDENGVSSFSALQQDLGGRGGKLVSGNAIFYAFDLLHYDGRDLTALPLIERKEALAALLVEAPHQTVRISEHFDTDGTGMLQHACKLGLEGIISKRADARYKSGRNDNWVKVKCSNSAEFVIAGYVPSTVSPSMIGSLVMGYYDKGKLVHIGRVGTGYTQKIAQDLKKRIDKVSADVSPFAEKLSADARRGVKWAKPVLVAEVEFRGWTHDGSLRHASYKGLREDKDAKTVVREVATDTPKSEKEKPKAKAGTVKKGVSVAGVPLTHPERKYWDGEGVTKQQLAEFYVEIADWILPHLVDRPLSLLRCPGGTAEKCFFQKHAWAGLGPGIREVDVPGDDEKMLAISGIEGLVSLVQAGVLEIHPWGSKQPKLTMPDQIIFDLDPGEDVPWKQIVAGAKDARERLKDLGLESFVKTTGGKGLHVVVPLIPEVGWDEAKAFARVFAEAMAGDSPDRYVSTMSKKIRTGRVFVDYLRNGQGATAVAAYSSRARKGAPVATPVTWEELGPDIRGDHFNVTNVVRRLQQLSSDPWKGFFKARQSLKPLLSKSRREAD